jgi:hypothetical protein
MSLPQITSFALGAIFVAWIPVNIGLRLFVMSQIRPDKRPLPFALRLPDEVFTPAGRKARSAALYINAAVFALFVLVALLGPPR